MPGRWTAVAGALVVACVAWAAIAAGNTLLAAGMGAVRALWLLPGLMALHLLQLMISSRAWRTLLVSPRPGRALFFRLRVVREGIDSLLPVAQIGGELVGARLLARQAMALPVAAASVVVDVTVEFLTQILFLLCGLAGLASLSSAPRAAESWAGAILLAGAVALALLLAQRMGILRLLEGLARQIAARWPAVADLSLDGLHAAAVAQYRRQGPMLRCMTLHWVAWMLGTLESWAVLQVLGANVSILQALVIESLGMAARSAGFAVPGALVVQETGFALAAAAAGVPEVTGLSLSVVKRVREVAVGLIGMALWRW